MFSLHNPFSPQRQVVEQAPASLLPGETCKRQREDDAVAAAHDIHILPCPHSHLDVPTTIVSLCPIHRARLPLAWLDPCEGSSLIPGSRFISAHIPDLEGETSYAISAPVVLIARPKFRDDLYAIERVRAGVYSSCRLASWVKASHIGDRAISSDALPVLPPVEYNNDEHSGEWWHAAAKTRVPSNTQERSAKRPRLIEPDVEDAPPSVAFSELPLPEQPTTSSQTPIELPIAGAEDDDMSSIPKPSAHEMISSLVTQYLETLYLSNASLAFFAKGPLSRARTQFMAGECLEQLPKALRDLVLTIAVTDKRYKETIIDVVKQQLASLDVQEGGVSAEVTSAKKTTRKKRINAKWSKEGTLPSEAEYIDKWWLATDIIDSSKSELRVRLAGLRFRETLLQLILILEALSIEAGLPKSDAGPDTTVAEAAPMEPVSKPQRKPKKPKDLASHAEALIDRLTIWLSVEAANDTEQAQESAARDEFLEPAIMVENGDRLRDFCVEVVVPFYGSRLPVLVAKLKQKMGLPSTPLSRRRRTATEEITKPPRLAPGAALSREDVTQKRLPLARVSSDTTKSRSAKPPSLLRSATDSFLHATHHERGKTPHPPRTDENGSPVSRPASRAGSIISESKAGNERHRRSLSRTSSMSQSLSNREVDTSIFAKFKQAKARKAALVEEEVRGAIANIKKPNRALAVKEVVDEADARSKRLQRKSHLSVQVNATPRRVRQQATFSTPGKEIDADVLELVPSTNPFVPASVMKIKHGPSSTSHGFASSRTLGHPNSSPFGFQTPSRHRNGGLPGAKASMSIGAGEETVPSSIAKGQGKAGLVAATPVKPSNGHKSHSQDKPFVVPATPAQAVDAEITRSVEGKAGVDLQGVGQGQDSSASIYAALGWDME